MVNLSCINTLTRHARQAHWYSRPHGSLHVVQKLTEYADRGDANKVKSLAGKENVSFNEFVDAFKAAPSVRASA